MKEVLKDLLIASTFAVILTTVVFLWIYALVRM